MRIFYIIFIHIAILKQFISSADPIILDTLINIPPLEPINYHNIINNTSGNHQKIILNWLSVGYDLAITYSDHCKLIQQIESVGIEQFKAYAFCAEHNLFNLDIDNYDIILLRNSIYERNTNKTIKHLYNLSRL